VPVKRLFAAAFLLAAVMAAPAGAITRGPTYVDFEDAPVGTDIDLLYPARTDVSFSDGDGCGAIEAPGGNFGPRFLRTSCSPIRITFNQPQAQVSLYGIASTNTSLRRPLGGPSPDLRLLAFDSQNVGIIVADFFGGQDVWTPLVVATDDGSAKIARVELSTFHDLVGVDDVGFSPIPQPDTDITSGPSGTVDTGDATFEFVGNSPPKMTFLCSLDGAQATPCASPATFHNLPDGQHTFTVTGVDAWGTSDKSPPGRTWTVAKPSPPVLDRDGDGVLDAADNCPDVANARQGDTDGDGIGDACEVLPPGNAPLQAGVDAKVRVVSGEVFVKLPPGAAASAFTAGLRVPFQDSGFLPLKGIATVPMGSTIDTRKGEIALAAAINGQRPASPRQLRREARYRAGIFAIRQARFRKGPRKKKIPPRAELTSAPGAEAACRRSGPPKGTRVRSLVTTAKGVFRTVGGAAYAAPAKGRSATFSTTDRCDGTVTSVGRGKVAVISRRTHKRTAVSAGRAFIVRARLFAAKGRGGG
jgi:hypothetical protein